MPRAMLRSSMISPGRGSPSLPVRRALATGAAILVRQRDGCGRHHPRPAPRSNSVICTLRDPAVPPPSLGRLKRPPAAPLRSSCWSPHLAGGRWGVGNAPTALFHLLEMLEAGRHSGGDPLGFSGRLCRRRRAKEALARVGAGSLLSRSKAGARECVVPPPLSTPSPANLRP